MTYSRRLFFLLLSCFIPASAYSQAVFSAAQSVYEATSQIHSFAVTDFDHDGNQDLVAISARGEFARDLVWFENDGTGQFADAQLLLMSLPATVNALSVADLDNDGDVDFIVGDASVYGSGGLFWIPNENGQAGLYRVINAIDSGIFRTIDFDSDGDMDLLQGGAAVKLYENTGDDADGRFQYAYALATGIARSMAVSDFDQDGDYDMVASVYGFERFNDVVRYYEQHRPGLMSSDFQSELASFSREQQVYRRLIPIAETADVDGDGAADLILGGHIDDDTPPNEGFLYWYRNAGRRLYHRDAQVIARAPRIQEPGTWGVGQIAVSDFDGDGDGDVALVRLVGGADSLFWYENPGLGNETPSGWDAHFIEETGFIVDELEAADLNNDGAMDLVTREGSSLRWYENLGGTGTGTSQVEAQVPRLTEVQSIWPNPSSGTVTVTYQLAQSARVNLDVFDVLGRVVATLVDEVQEPGMYESVFDASHLPSGTYVYRLTAGTFTQAKSMVLAK